jgi:hypothetical protein
MIPGSNYEKLGVLSHNTGRILLTQLGTKVSYLSHGKILAKYSNLLNVSKKVSYFSIKAQ